MLSTAYKMIDLKGTTIKTTATTVSGLWDEIKELKKPIVLCNYSISGSNTKYENSFKLPIIYTDKIELIQVVAGVTTGLIIQRIIIEDDDTIKYVNTDVKNPTP